MNKVLKKESLKSLMPKIIITAVLTIAFLAVACQGLLMMISGPTELSNVNLEEAEGEYVSFDASEVIVAFATWSVSNDSETKVLETYYLLPYGEGTYIAVMDAEENNASVLDRAMEQSYEYYLGDLETLTRLGTLSGTVKPLEEGMTDYMVDCIENYTLPGYEEGANTANLIYPLQINVDQVGFLYSNTAALLGVIGLVFLALTLLLLIPALVGVYQKKAAEIVAEELTAEEAESAFAEAVTIEKIRVGKFIWYQKGATTKALSTRNLIWGYPMPEPLVVSKCRWPVALYDEEQNCTQICFMEKKNREKFLAAIAAQGHPFIDTYTSELAQKFKTNLEGFKKEAQQAAKEREAE